MVAGFKHLKDYICKGNETVLYSIHGTRFRFTEHFNTHCIHIYNNGLRYYCFSLLELNKLILGVVLG